MANSFDRHDLDLARVKTATALVSFAPWARTAPGVKSETPQALGSRACRAGTGVAGLGNMRFVPAHAALACSKDVPAHSEALLAPAHCAGTRDRPLA